MPRVALGEPKGPFAASGQRSERSAAPATLKEAPQVSRKFSNFSATCRGQPAAPLAGQPSRRWNGNPPAAQRVSASA